MWRSIVGLKKFLIPSEAHKIWHETQSWAIKKFRPNQVIEKCKVDITFYAPDKRKADLSNKAESIMDLLVDCHFIVDDNWFICDDLALHLAGVDRENPRVHIIIEEVTDKKWEQG